MKTFMSIIFCAVMLFISCDNNQKKVENEESTNEQSTSESLETEDFKEAKNCDEFIEQYEKWTDDYIVLIEKYMKSPMDTTLSQEYMKVAQESMAWMTQWNGELASCASKDEYQKRFDEITEKAEAKLKELGIE